MDTNQMLMMMMMNQMKNADLGGENDRGGRAFRKIHSIRQKCEKQPEQVVAAYLDEVMAHLGAEQGDLWQPWQMTRTIHWGNMAGLHRCHFHVSHILRLSLKAENRRAEAYLVQLLRALHQVALDGGTWATGSLLLPTRDPLFKQACGGTEEELEAIVSYQ